MIYNKLVRDKIPEYIISKGKKPIIHIAGKKEYWQKLKEKLGEEVKEFQKSEKLEEIADILEVIDAIIIFKKIDKGKLKMLQQQKTKERGAFKKRIILEKT